MHDSSWLSLQVGIILTENCWDCRRKNLRRIIIAAAVASLPNYLQFLRAFERPPRLKTQLLERLARTMKPKGFSSLDLYCKAEKIFRRKPGIDSMFCLYTLSKLSH